MAYDGLFIKYEISEIKNLISNEHISKISQISQFEIILIFRKDNKNLNFSLSCNPNFPHILLSNESKENLSTPPSFCMLLRKYLSGGEIKNIYQINSELTDNGTLERVVNIEIENVGENGEYMLYHLIIEIMGKYSNIILTDKNFVIIDTMLKGKQNAADKIDYTNHSRLSNGNVYSLHNISTKKEFFDDTSDFVDFIKNKKTLALLNNEKFSVFNAMSSYLNGISTNLIECIFVDFLNENNFIKTYENDEAHKINTDNDASKMYSNENNLADTFDSTKNTTYYLNNNFIEHYFFNELNLENDNLIRLSKFCDYLIKTIKEYTASALLSPCINILDGKAKDLYLFKLSQYSGDIKYFKTINECLENYIKIKFANINDSTEKKNIENVIKNLYVALNKKIDIYKKDLKNCEGFEKYKMYGDLVAAYGYDKNLINDNILTCENYLDNNKKINIELDGDLSIAENIKHFYDKYNKYKRTIENCETLINETNEKLEHLNSIKASLDISDSKNDIFFIKEEIKNYFKEANKYNLATNKKENKNFNNKNLNNKNFNKKINYNISHYKSSTGVDIYVGKNNLQNEYLTFELAAPNDTWFHIKNSTGSHVIVKKPYTELDDKTLIEAASLAAYFSDKKNETKATVDYTLRKELKKVKGKAPGFCIYHKNYSINVKPKLIEGRG